MVLSFSTNLDLIEKGQLCSKLTAIKMTTEFPDRDQDYDRKKNQIEKLAMPNHCPKSSLNLSKLNCEEQFTLATLKLFTREA